MSMSLHLTSAEHEVTYQEIVKLLDAKAGKLDAMDILAVAANLVGKLVAMQDHRLYTPVQAMEIIAANITEGNKQALAELHKAKGTA